MGMLSTFTKAEGLYLGLKSKLNYSKPKYYFTPSHKLTMYNCVTVLIL